MCAAQNKRFAELQPARDPNVTAEHWERLIAAVRNSQNQNHLSRPMRQAAAPLGDEQQSRTPHLFANTVNKGE